MDLILEYAIGGAVLIGEDKLSICFSLDLCFFGQMLYYMISLMLNEINQH